MRNATTRSSVPGTPQTRFFLELDSRAALLWNDVQALFVLLVAQVDTFLGPSYDYLTAGSFPYRF